MSIHIKEMPRPLSDECALTSGRSMGTPAQLLIASRSELCQMDGTSYF